MKKTIWVLFLLGFSLMRLNAQEGITVSGGDASGSGGSVSSSVGQVVYTSGSNANGSVAEGVQQPYIIISLPSSLIDSEKDLTGVLSETAKAIDLYCAYPNPTKDLLFLKAENFNAFDLSFQLYDLSGKLLDGKKILSDITNIDMSNYAQGTFILKVINNSTEVKTFKIIKN